MKVLSYLIVLGCLLISCHTSYGERISMESEENAISGKSLAPGYKSCPQRLGANNIVQIEVPGLWPFYVSCESNIAGPGWIVIARRSNDKTNFFLKWEEYKHGFGELSGDFFLGLDKIHAITGTQNHELYIHLEDFEGQTRYARYDQFYIENENMQYQLTKANGFSGDAGNGLDYQKGMKFSTYDKDHTGHCAVDRMGAWWYNGCANSNLFALYLGGEYSTALEAKGMHWKSWRGLRYAYKRMVMMVRPT
ncbi:uncharacterized protein Dwil_GK15362 [Drosophila willistoni]|uniref:Fibrinogen C-terminal domain-containing protein n=1 Tax=Drosophila willistoni TaxID=7260 RepID=B4MUR3_DROWI|nr:ficolin-2 [Drosophila willistoni]EDW76258.2 uncharacterized protein Dwil_GK15362 [Drosophila willistoni]